MRFVKALLSQAVNWMRSGWTLRGKGLLVFGLMVLYVLVMGFHLMGERARLTDIITEL